MSSHFTSHRSVFKAWCKGGEFLTTKDAKKMRRKVRGVREYSSWTIGMTHAYNIFALRPLPEFLGELCGKKPSIRIIKTALSNTRQL